MSELLKGGKRMEGDQRPAKKKIPKLNAEIPEDLFTRLRMFCVRENMKIKEVTAMALESFLDEMEGSK